MKKLMTILALGTALVLAGCETDGVKPEALTQYQAIVPPNTLYSCPGKPTRPTGTLTDAKVAEYIVRLDRAHSVCSKSLTHIKAFADQAKLAVEQN
jgi:hypothetical protein